MKFCTKDRREGEKCHKLICILTLRKSPRLGMRREKDERLLQESVWVLVCPLTSHFDTKKIKLGQKKTLGESCLEKDKWKKWIFHLNLKAVKSKLISQAHTTCKRELLNLCAALAKILSSTLASLFFLTENFMVSFNYNSCQGRSWFLKRKAWSFAMEDSEY